MSTSSFGDISEHFQDPQNRGRLLSASAVGQAGSAGQFGTVTLYLRIEQNTVVDARHESQGCGYTVACASMLTEWLKGQSLGAAVRLSGEEFRTGIAGLPAYKAHCPYLLIEALHDALASKSLQRDGSVRPS